MTLNFKAERSSALLARSSGEGMLSVEIGCRTLNSEDCSALSTADEGVEAFLRKFCYTSNVAHQLSVRNAIQDDHKIPDSMGQ